MGSLVLAVGFVVLAAAVFVASVRLGILLGRRLDRSVEARRQEDDRGE